MTDQIFCSNERKFFENMIMDEFMDEFFIAVERGYINAVRYLIEYNAFVGAKDDLALRKAVQNQNLDMVKLLVEHGADPTVIFGLSSVSVDILKYLFNTGVEPEQKQLSLLLIKSCNNENPDVVKLLLEHKADPQADDNFPLGWASYNGHFDIVKFLIENKADVNSRDGDPIYNSSLRGDLDMVKLLVDNKADVGSSVLQIARETQKYWVVDFLTTCGGK